MQSFLRRIKEMEHNFISFLRYNKHIMKGEYYEI